MDGFYQYQNLLGSYNPDAQAEKAKSDYERELAAKKKEVGDLTTGLTESFITDATQDLVKAGFKKAGSVLRSKGEAVARAGLNRAKKGIVATTQQVREDLRTGGLKKALENQGRRAKAALQQGGKAVRDDIEGAFKKRLGKAATSEARAELLSEPRSLVTAVARRAPAASSFFGKDRKFFNSMNAAASPEKSSTSIYKAVGLADSPVLNSLDKDLVKSLGDNPSINQLRSTLLNQSARDVVKGKASAGATALKLGVDDMTDAQRKGIKVALPKLAPDLNELKAGFSDRRTALKSAFRTLDPDEKSLFRAQIKDANDALDRRAFNSATEFSHAKILNQERIMGIIKNEGGGAISASTDTAAKKLATTAASKIEQQLGGDALGDVGDLATSILTGGKGVKKKLEAGGKALGQKAAEKGAGRFFRGFAEGEGEGGGPEDVIGDIVGLVSGIAGLFGGLHREHHLKMTKPHIPLGLQPSVQIGA